MKQGANMKSLYKALDILETLSSGKEMQLSEISKSTGLKKPTTNRIVSALVKRNYLIHKKKRGNYSLNTSLINIKLGSERYEKLKEVALPFLMNISNKFNENIVLGVPSDGQVYVLAITEIKNILSAKMETGTLIPSYCTGVGKIFLANLSENELDAYFNQVEMKKFTFNTITDQLHLRASLKMIREEGVAYDDEEQTMGVKNVSVGIFDINGGIIASIGITAPAVRLPRERITEMLPELKNCAKAISEALT
jgi:DNA-binding IclR family transcriptional regulator